MGTLHTIDTANAPRRAGESRDGTFATELDLPTWEEFTDARERFFAAVATAPLPPARRREPAAEPVVRS